MTTSTAPPAATPGLAPAPRWPYLGRPQRRLLVAALLVLVGAVTPWIDTVAGTVLGVAGGGVHTLAAGGMGLAGVCFRRRGVVIAHALVLAAVPLVLGGWQAVRLVAVGCDFRACAPGFGLVLTLAGGAVAAAASWQLLRGTPTTR
jgi:hypothetical protein